jgi:hypothetical protein
MDNGPSADNAPSINAIVNRLVFLLALTFFNYILSFTNYLLGKALFVNFVAICTKKGSGTKGSIGKLLNDLRKDATKTD